MVETINNALIEFAGVDLGYGKRKILTGINLRVAVGDFLGIVGPNGAGKTTMLKAILGLLKPLSGEVRTTEEGLRIGYVPQRDSVDSLFPLTVMDIVLMGRYKGIGPLGWPNLVDKQAAVMAIEHVGITDLSNRPYPNLSGGQKQRALIARALVGNPNLLILDEPTNGMDLASERAIMELVRHLHDQDGITVLMVSHLLNTVVNYAHRIAIVGDGVIREGVISNMITSEALSALYSLPVQVVEVDGRRVILPPGSLEPDVISHSTGGAN